MALTDLMDREAMAVMLGCTADDVRRARELYQKNKEKGIVPKDVRTEMQRRFDAIAEEVLYGGSLPVRGAKPKP